MQLTFVTFGQDHTHEVNGKIFTKDTVAVIQAENAEAGRQAAFNFFGSAFCFEYPQEHFDPATMAYFPAGFVSVNF
jgi:hypothetical protein